MKLGILAGYGGKVLNIDIQRIKMAESLGYDSLWTAEAYGSDAVTPAAWILAQTDKIKVGTAIMQMPARSPACSAMTAMTLNQLSNGRFMVGAWSVHGRVVYARATIASLNCKRARRCEAPWASEIQIARLQNSRVRKQYVFLHGRSP